MIYLDNAATTYKKPREVRSAVQKALKIYSGNAGRGAHKASLKTAELVFETRQAVASLLNFDYPERVVFTLNATFALNLAIKSLIKNKCHVIISDVEHNSVFRPIKKLEKTIGITYSTFKSGATDLKKEIISHITPNTKYIVSTLASNVTGAEIPLKVLSDISVKHGLKLIVDASQYVGHKRIDLSATPCSAFCAPAHKGLYGISGLGFVIFNTGLSIDTFIEGGSGNNSKSYEMPLYLPERLEGGTLPSCAISALNGGISFINNIGMEKIENKYLFLTEKTYEMILNVPNSIIYAHNNGIVSFNLKWCNSEELCALLDDYGICVRGGLHCAPLAHKTLGTLTGGTVRVSTSYFTRELELYRFYKALRCIEKSFYNKI